MNSFAVSSALIACGLLCLPPARSQDIGEAAAIPAKPHAVRPGQAPGRIQNPSPTSTNRAKSPSTTSEIAIGHLNRNDARDAFEQRIYVQETAQAPPQEAIPVLERYYAKHRNDPGLQGERPIRVDIASALVRLGNRDPLYWNIIVAEAEASLASAVPFPSNNGKGAGDSYTPAQKAWGKAHNMSPAQMAMAASYAVPEGFAPLARSQDPRGTPILQRGLKSQNSIIQMLAANGLAALHDKSSIPLIIDACHNTVASGHLIARSLIYFNDPAADKAFQEYFPDLNIEQERQRRGDNPFGSAVSIGSAGSNAATPAPLGFSVVGAAPAQPPRTRPTPDTAPVPAQPHL